MSELPPSVLAEFRKLGDQLAKGELVAAISLLDYMLYKPDDLAETIADAIYLATGERYQVHIER